MCCDSFRGEEEEREGRRRKGRDQGGEGGRRRRGREEKEREGRRRGEERGGEGSRKRKGGRMDCVQEWLILTLLQ